MLLAVTFYGWGQDHFSLLLSGPDKQGLPFSTVELLRADSSLLQSAVTDSLGQLTIGPLPAGKYILRSSRVNFQTVYQSISLRNTNGAKQPHFVIVLQPLSAQLSEVVVNASKPMIKQVNGKTIVNVEGSINATGSSVLELLERTPGVTVDKDGNISLKGRPEVLLMIDGKLTYVSGAELATLLSGMSSAQVETIELMDHPPANFDAAGNAGIINIRTKKLKQKGTNANISLSVTQGRYPKTNNSLGLNHRSGAFNFFMNYSLNADESFANLYAFRTYFATVGKPASYLEQPTFIRGSGTNHSLRAGMDYAISAATSIGFTVAGTDLSRKRVGNGPADWLNESREIDSSVFTKSINTTRWRNGAANINLRQQFRNRNELAADLDYLVYDIANTQNFSNELQAPNGYLEQFRGNLPSTIKIAAAKLDYSDKNSTVWQWASGIKASRISTNNIAAFEVWQDPVWIDDLNRSNHFLYTENIYAAYTNGNYAKDKWKAEAGLRFEHTAYDANQFGNASGKDSAFSRDYSSLFPSATISYELDSVNSFSIHVGRRIDRPAFQKLNPFTIILNKYTYQSGNPFIRPQYTWNFEVSHQFKELLTTSIGYNIINDYFTQMFYSNDEGTIIYTDGNLGKMNNLSLSVMLQLAPVSGWNMVLNTIYNHKELDGFVWQPIHASINQLQVSLNNQLRFGKKWTGELSGYFISRNQNDITEVLDPTGQVSLGIGRQIMKGKGTLKLSFRDIFYTQAMAGNTAFQHAHEYFKLTRDTRVATLAFSYRFSKGQKTTQHKSGGAGEEAERVSN